MHRDRLHRDVDIFEPFSAETDPRSAATAGRTGEHALLTLAELGRACRVDTAQLSSLIDQGVLAPSGADSSDWRFDDRTRRRAHAAVRLSQDLEPDPVGTALVIELLDRIDALGSQMRRLSQV